MSGWHRMTRLCLALLAGSLLAATSTTAFVACSGDSVSAPTAPVGRDPTGGSTSPETTATTPAPVVTAEVTPAELCRVRSITDGDTIEVSGCDDAGTIRLLLVDSPESGGDCYAAEATNYVRERLLGRPVRLERDVTDTDQYGRKLRYIWIGDELFNETLVREGYAKLLVFENVKYLQRIEAAEAQARAESAGLWGECGAGNCDGPVLITGLDKRAEVVTLSGSGDMTGWQLVSERGAATQRFSFPRGFILQGSVQVLSATPRFPNTADRLWWSADNLWNNSEDDDALLIDSGGQLVCEFDDGQ